MIIFLEDNQRKHKWCFFNWNTLHISTEYRWQTKQYKTERVQYRVQWQTPADCCGRPISVRPCAGDTLQT